MREKTLQHIGFIGLGIMGRPMAHRLLEAGFSLKVYARRPEAAQSLLEQGAQWAASPREVAEEVDCLITMVSDSPDVERLLFGEEGAIEGLKTGAVVVDMSTISPLVTRRIAGKLAEKGIQMLDAPVSGGEQGAIAGTLSIMVGGETEVFEQLQPIFACLGSQAVHIGAAGAGQVAKACNQIIAAISIEAVAEAMAFAQAQGVEAQQVRQALLGGFAGSKILEVHGQRMLDHNFKPGFKAKLHAKDMRIVLQEAQDLGLPLPAASMVSGRLASLVHQGGGEQDSSALFTLIKP